MLRVILATLCILAICLLGVLSLALHWDRLEKWCASFFEDAPQPDN